MPAAMEDPTALQVDFLILDYLLWYATSALLTERRVRAAGSDSAEASDTASTAVRLVHCFHQHFTTRHPHLTLPEDLSIRLRLTRFTALLLRRVDPLSATLAPSPGPSARTARWLSRRSTAHVLDESLFASTPFPPSPRSPRADGPATLRDALWELMLLSTQTSAATGEVSQVWMTNAVTFMQQAVLESYLDLGCTGPAAADECFSYGLVPVHPEDCIEEVVVNELFAGDAGRVGRDFEALRREALADFVPRDGLGGEGGREGGEAFRRRLEELARECPWDQCEEALVEGYVAAVAKKLGLPVLAQLQEGRLDGFKDEEVRRMMAEAGVEEVWAR